MAKIITAAQEQVLETLTGEQVDAVIAFGGDLYHEGMIKGAFIGITGCALGVIGVAFVQAFVVPAIHKHKESKRAEGQK